MMNYHHRSRTGANHLPTPERPSAGATIEEVWRRNILSKLRVSENKVFQQQYAAALRKETDRRTYFRAGFVVSILLSILFESLFPAIVGLIGLFSSSFQKRNSDEILCQFEDEINRQSMAADSSAQKVEKMMSEEEAMILGDKIIAHEGSVVINRSVVLDSFNKTGQTDETLARAISTLAGFIEQSGNKAAADNFEDLLSGLGDQPRPSLIRSSWKEIVRLLPEVESLVSVVGAITKLFD